MYFTFQKRRGRDFVLDYDAYIRPSAQLANSATVELIVHGVVVAKTTPLTWLVP